MKNSLFSVSFAGLWGQHTLSLEESIVKTAELGYDGIEIMGKRPHLSPLDYSVEDCKRLRDLLAKHDLQTAAVAAYTNFSGGADSAEVPFGEMQIGYVEALAERAAILGGEKLVRVFSSYESRLMSPFENWQRTVTGLRECCDRAAVHGVTIGLQNHHDVAVSCKAMLELIKQVGRENLIPMVDLWSMHLRKEQLGEDFLALVRMMRFTTIADYSVLRRFHYVPEVVNYREVEPALVMAVPMGEGDLDYRSFLNAMNEAGFDGWVSYETCSPIRGGGGLPNLEYYARRFVDQMTRLTGKRSLRG